MTSKPGKKKRLQAEPYTDVQSEFQVQWWDGVEWRNHYEFESAEEAIAASRKQNRAYEESEPGLVYYTRPVRLTTITTELTELL